LFDHLCLADRTFKRFSDRDAVDQYEFLANIRIQKNLILLVSLI